jgi:hypothetical protein
MLGTLRTHVLIKKKRRGQMSQFEFTALTALAIGSMLDY